MKRILICSILALGVGFWLGRFTAPKAAPVSLNGAAVDCYDANGKLIEDAWFKKFGGLQLSCAPGQTAKLHQAK
jgi:hypothetical protein